jgi:hypothetical protein
VDVKSCEKNTTITTRVPIHKESPAAANTFSGDQTHSHLQLNIQSVFSRRKNKGNGPTTKRITPKGTTGVRDNYARELNRARE